MTTAALLAAASYNAVSWPICSFFYRAGRVSDHCIQDADRDTNSTHMLLRWSLSHLLD